MKEKLTSLLNSHKYICTTADIWSSNNKSYLGMTVHIVDENENFKRKSYALACCRLLGRHTYNIIAKAMMSVHEKYGITISKITHCVTDNASNFAKAFNVFHSIEEDEIFEIQAAQSSNGQNTFLYDNDMDDEDEDIEFEELLIVNNNYDDSLSDIELPLQMRCCAHTLNLLATADAKKAEKDNLLKRSTLASDKAEEICQTKFVRPNQTRWNATYNGLRIIDNKKHVVNLLMEQLDLPKFKNVELCFIEEYIKVMEPVAMALNILQGENNMYLGYIISTVRSLKKKLESITHSVHCAALIKIILSKLSTRFDYVWNLELDTSRSFILAAISHPKFKLSWINEATEEEFCKNIFLQECDRQAARISEMSEESSSADSEDFFSVLSDSKSSTSISRNTNIAQMQGLSFLEDKEKNVTMLKKYELVKEIFLKYNTTLPSSAPVERLFSSGGQIMTPRRNKLSDMTFETLLLLKANKDL